MRRLIFFCTALLMCIATVMADDGTEISGDGVEISRIYTPTDVDSMIFRDGEVNLYKNDEVVDHFPYEQMANFKFESDDTWTVMFYSVGGGNLDTAQVLNISQAMRAKINPNIHMTFQFKFSKDLQSKKVEGLQGTFRFDMEEVHDALGEEASNYDDLGRWMNKIETTYVGDATYDMSSASSLTDFINWSKSKHPAGHYLLIVSDHGSGWNATKDNEVTEAKGSIVTGILSDDNNGKKELSAASLEQGIQNSEVKKVDAIYEDACLMATAENLFQYSTVADYCLAAVELTPAMGGEYTLLLNMIGENPSDAWTWGRNYVDYLTSANHWGQSIYSWYSDIGIYNLSKLCDEEGDVVKTVKAFTEQLKEDYSDKADKINTAVLHTQVSQNTDFGTNEFPTSLFPDFTFVQDDKASMSEVRRCYEQDPTYFITVLRANYKKMHNNMEMLLYVGLSYGLIMADFMNQLSTQIGEPYTTYYENYVNAIKNCAYIKSSLKPDDGDYPYTNLSMSVNIYGMTETALKYWDSPTSGEGWLDATGMGLSVGNESMFTGNAAKTPEELQTAYKESRFDQCVDWCDNFLSRLTVNPGFFFNCSSEDLVKREK